MCLNRCVRFRYLLAERERQDHIFDVIGFLSDLVSDAWTSLLMNGRRVLTT